MPLFKFDDIAENLTAKRKPTEADMQTYIGLEHLESGSLFVHNFGSDVPIKGEKLIMTRGDILLGKRNAYLKRAAIAPHDGLFSAHGMILRPREKVIDKRFFPFFIASDIFFDEAIRISVGSLSPTINWRDLKELEFNLPLIEEQRKLADLLWSAYDLKESYKRLLAASDEMAKSRFVEMFGDPRTNPNGYDIKELRDTCSVITGNTPSRAVTKYYGKFIEWIKTDNIVAGMINPTQAAEYLSEEGKKVGRVVPKEVILMACIAGSVASIGKVCITDREVAFNQQINAIIPIDYDVRFLYVMLQISKGYLVEEINMALKGILSKSKLEDKRFYVPPIALQKEFADFFEQLDKSKVALQKGITALDDTIKTILHKTFFNEEEKNNV